MATPGLSAAPTAAELLALDLLTLREHTEQAGDRLDPEAHAAQLGESLRSSRLCWIRRDAEVIAYAMLKRVSATSWFIAAFNIHPQHRSAPVIEALMRQVATLLADEGALDLSSHVYKTNRRSLAFHARLGFRVARENDKAVAFFATLQDIAAAPGLKRWLRQPALSQAHLHCR